jgi:hypothetical protein
VQGPEFCCTDLGSFLDEKIHPWTPDQSGRKDNDSFFRRRSTPDSGHCDQSVIGFVSFDHARIFDALVIEQFNFGATRKPHHISHMMEFAAADARDTGVQHSPLDCEAWWPTHR